MLTALLEFSFLSKMIPRPSLVRGDGRERMSWDGMGWHGMRWEAMGFTRVDREQE